MLLQHVKEDREGFYLCQANNGIGTGIGKVIQLKVNCEYQGDVLDKTKVGNFPNCNGNCDSGAFVLAASAAAAVEIIEM